MSLVSKLTSFMGGGLVESISNVADKFITTDDEKNAFMVEMEQVLQKRDSEIEQTIRAELSAKERIIVAEMSQGDNYTKRARPTVVYAGLAIIAFNYCAVPALQSLSGVVVDPFSLPAEFWIAWGGCVGIWTIGRSVEKRGNRNAVTQTVTGNKPVSFFD